MILLFSRLHPGPMRSRIGHQMELVARRPDAGSEFEQLTLSIRHLPDGDYLDALLQTGYDCVLAFQHGQIVGYLAHQRKEEQRESHCFSLRSMDGFDGNGLGTRLTEFWLRSARGQKAVRARLWAEDRLARLKHAKQMRRIYARMVENRGNLGFTVAPYECGEPGWIDLCPEAAIAAA